MGQAAGRGRGGVSRSRTTLGGWVAWLAEWGGGWQVPWGMGLEQGWVESFAGESGEGAGRGLAVGPKACIRDGERTGGGGLSVPLVRGLWPRRTDPGCCVSVDARVFK